MKEEDRKREIQAAVELAREVALGAKTTGKRRAAPKDEDIDEEDEDTTTATAKLSTNLKRKKKGPAVPSMASSAPAKSAKSAKAKKATKAKVELKHTASRAYWLARVRQQGG